MAITGAHVQCGYVQDIAGAKLFVPIWSQTIALGSPTTLVAPSDRSSGVSGALVFRVRALASGEMFAVAGANPDATQAIGSTQDTARSHFIASDEKDLPAQPGWKVSVASA